MPQYPRIHSNGSSSEQLLSQYRAAHDAVKGAIDAVRGIDVHGRDYYVISDQAATDAAKEHRARLTALQGILDDIIAIHRDIYRQSRQKFTA